MPGQSSGESRAVPSAWRASRLLTERYEPQGELGRGGMADVYRARDRRTGEALAIKIIRARTSDDDDALARFAREARTTGKLDHPSIVPILAAHELEEGGLALVMPLVPGHTLREVVRRAGPLPFDRVASVLRDVAGALGAAHALGIVHRDVKPENIFIDDRDGRALLADFGIARAIDSETVVTRTGMAIGTPAYMSPEQIDGRDVDGQSDIYSLGLVGWEMLSGVRPWAGESLYSIIYKQKHEELPLIRAVRPDTPEYLATTVDGALVKDKSVRWPSTEALLAQLEYTSGVLPSERGRAIATLLAARTLPAAMDHNQTAVFRRPARDGEVVIAEELVDPLRPSRRRWLAIPAAAALIVAAVLAVRLADSSGANASGNDATTARSPSAEALPSPAQERPDGSNGGMSDPRAGPDGAQAAAIAALEMSDRVEPALSADSVRTLVSRAVAESLAAIQRESRTTSAGEVVAEGPPSPATPTTPTPTPVPAEPSAEPLPSSAIVSVAAGGIHTCYVTAGGEAYCWGGNARGQLGTGEGSRSAEPTRVAGSVRFRSISASVAHSCGVAQDGRGYCWGANDRGQLGDGSASARTAPSPVAGGRSFRDVRTGMSHSCGLTSDGDVYCWGAGNGGQLGNGQSVDSPRPSKVASDERFIALAVGWNHACALTSAGSAVCWGQNAAGQLGEGTATNHDRPVTVAGDFTFRAIAAGGAHSCAVTTHGATYCWGRNDAGQVGDGTTQNRLQPVRVTSDLSFVSVTLGSVHSCALSRDGRASCWGRNSYGQLGDGGTSDRSTPSRVQGGHVFSRVDASGAHTCGVTGSGESFCWGYNVEGQLGDGTRSHRTRPVYVEKPAG